MGYEKKSQGFDLHNFYRSAISSDRKICGWIRFQGEEQNLLLDKLKLKLTLGNQ